MVIQPLTAVICIKNINFQKTCIACILFKLPEPVPKFVDLLRHIVIHISWKTFQNIN